MKENLLDRFRPDFIKGSFLNKLFFFLLILGLVPYIWSSFYCYPIADDYSYSVHSIKNGYLNTVIGDYFHWNGRYASNFLVLANPLVWKNLTLYQFVPILLISLTIIGFFVFFSQLLKDFYSKLFILNLSILSTLFYLFQMPSVAEGIYWYTGSVSYQLSNILFLMYSSLLLKAEQGSVFITRKLDGIIAGMLLFILIGFNEVIMLLMLFFHSFLYLRVYNSETKEKGFIKVMLIVSIIGALFMLLAPGNAVRSSNYADSHNLVRSFAFTFMQMNRFFFEWISSIPFVLGSILLVPIVYTIQSKRTFKSKFLVHHPLLAFLMLLMVLFLCIFPPYWTTNILGQHRTVNTAYFFFILVWISNIFSWVDYLKEKSNFQLDSKYKIMLVLSIFFSLVFTKNSYLGITDLLNGTSKQFSLEMESRINLLQQASKSGSQVLMLKPLVNKPKLLFVLDLTENPEYWINKGYGDYYLNKVALNICP